MKTLRVFAFLMAFSVEIHVHAEMIQTPEGCLKTDSYCVFKSKENSPSKEVVTKNDATLSLEQDSTVISQSENDFSLVKGKVLVKANQDAIFETPYGKLTIKAGTQAILEKETDHVNIQTIFGKVLVQPLGNKKSIYVLEGRENILSEVDKSMKAQTGVPKPILVESFLKTWAHLTTADKEDFLNDVEKFKEIHKNAVKELSFLNDQIVQREISSAKAEKKAKIEREKQEKARLKASQEMYYHHLLGQ